MRIVLVGPGRAGQSIVLAATGAGHDVVAVAARDAEHARSVARRLEADVLAIGEPIPPVDLIIVAVRDHAIEEVAAQIAPVARSVAASAVHLSGSTSVAALAPFEAQGLAVGSLHPLQTMPTPERGARSLAGSWMAVTADDPLRSRLHTFAASIGGLPFDLPDGDRATYHAAAAAAANFPIAAFSIAQRLLDSTGVPFNSIRPLIDSIVANTFELGPAAALTGPVARGDVGTVDAQLAAVRSAAPDLAAAFEAMLSATGDVAAARGSEGGV